MSFGSAQKNGPLGAAAQGLFQDVYREDRKSWWAYWPCSLGLACRLGLAARAAV